MPVGAPTFAEALRTGVEVYHPLKKVLQGARASPPGLGTRAASRRTCGSSEAAIEILEAAERAGHRKAGAIALDVAASELFHDGKYHLESRVRLARRWWVWYDSCGKYPIVSIEDGLAEDDWDGWKELTDELGARVQLVGDDLFVTNAARLRRGIERGIANAILVKVNQIGTLTETLEAVRARAARAATRVISHRSGETEDATIADLAVAIRCGPDQDRARLRGASGREVQPAAADRGAARRPRDVSGVERASRGRAASLSSMAVVATPHEDRRHDRARVLDARRAGAARRSVIDGARLNFSHGTHEDHAARAEAIRDGVEGAPAGRSR